jgi:GNAT superfamily N-acetyltransferase
MGSLPSWHEEPISKHHDCKEFDCGDPELNEFLWRYARQSHERGGAKTFIAVDDANGISVHGYYSLSPASVEYARAPEVVRRGLGRYEIRAYRLSRLAVSTSLQGCGLGGQLLLAAGLRCLRVAEQAGGTVILIDAKNDGVAAWYASYGAMPLLDAPRLLVLPLKLVRKAREAAGKLP